MLCIKYLHNLRVFETMKMFSIFFFTLMENRISSYLRFGGFFSTFEYLKLISEGIHLLTC